MEKRSPKLPLCKEKAQSSCIWGLVHMLRFRNGRRNQKLLTNGRPLHKKVLDTGQPRNVDTLANSREKQQCIEGGGNWAIHDIDAFETHVKDLLREEIATPKKTKKHIKASKVQHKSSDFAFLDQLQKNHKKASKTSKRNDQKIPIHHSNDEFLLRHSQSSCSAEITSDKHELEAMLEEICIQIHEDRSRGDIQRYIAPFKHSQHDQVNMQQLQMSAKALIDQIYINGKHNGKEGGSRKSKQFSDASEILKLNMDLFLKFLQEPNSLLLKNIQKLPFPLRDKERMKFFLDSKLSESGISGGRHNQDLECTMKLQKKDTNNHFWRKLRSGYECSSEGNTSSQASNEIVLLKPKSKGKQNPENVSCLCASLQSHQSLKTKGQNTRATYFSFKDIKRKFKQAVGESQKKQNIISLDESLIKLARSRHHVKDVEKRIRSGTTTGESALSPDAKRREKQWKFVDLTSSNGPQISSITETVCKKLNSSPISFSKQRQLDIFMEAKRHLSERLKNVDVGKILPRKEAPRTLEMILSSREQDFLATHSPKRDRSASVSEQMTFSPYSNSQMTTESSLQIEKGKSIALPHPPKQTEEVPSCSDFTKSDDQLEMFEHRADIPNNLSADSLVLDGICSLKAEPIAEDSASTMETSEVMLQGDSNILELSYEPNGFGDTSNMQSTQTMKFHEDNGYTESENLPTCSENFPRKSSLDPSSPLDICRLQIVDGVENKEQHTSPVSVLEQFFSEDVDSPTSITSEPAESKLQPRRLSFDYYSHVSSKDLRINTITCMDEEDPLYLYVRAVKQASSLNFDELTLRAASPPQVQHSFIENGAGLFEVESDCDLKLLLDCIHEVLIELYQFYFGCSPWLSFLKPKLMPAPLEENIVNEVVKEVNFYLLPKVGQPTLDQLVGKEMEKSGSWLDLRCDTEDILIQIAEDILRDSIVDAIFEVHISFSSQLVGATESFYV